jgi:hypothetical protein
MDVIEGFMSGLKLTEFAFHVIYGLCFTTHSVGLSDNDQPNLTYTVFAQAETPLSEDEESVLLWASASVRWCAHFHGLASAFLTSFTLQVVQTQ